MFRFLRRKVRGEDSDDSGAFKRPAVLMRLKDLSKFPDEGSAIPTPSMAAEVLEHHYKVSGSVLLGWGRLLKRSMSYLQNSHRIGVKLPQISSYLQIIELSLPSDITISGDPTISILLLNDDFPEQRHPWSCVSNSPDYFTVMVAKELTVLLCASVDYITPNASKTGVLIGMTPSDKKFTSRVLESQISSLIKETQI